MSSRIVLLGLPGAGKGTVGLRLAENLGLTFISLGDEVRRLAKEDSPVGRNIRSHWESSNGWRPLPDSLAIVLANECLGGVSGWVLDGFPRNVLQAESLPVTDLIVHLLVSEETSTQRVLGRGREGDGLEKLLARLEAERERLLPLLEYCRQRWPVIDIDANPSQEAVWQALWKEVRKWKN